MIYFLYFFLIYFFIYLFIHSWIHLLSIYFFISLFTQSSHYTNYATLLFFVRFLVQKHLANPIQIIMTKTKKLMVLCPFQEQAIPSPLSFYLASIINKKSNLLEYIVSTNLLFPLCFLGTRHFGSLPPSRMYVNDCTTHHKNWQFHFSNLFAMPLQITILPAPKFIFTLTILHYYMWRRWQ